MRVKRVDLQEYMHACDEMIARVRGELLEHSSEDPEQASNDAYQLDASYCLLDMLTRKLFGPAVSDLDPTSSILCLLMYYLMKISEDENFTYRVRAFPKHFGHVIGEVSIENTVIAYCDPAFFEYAIEPSEKEKLIKQASIKLIRVAEEEKNVLESIETNIIKEEKDILKQYINRLKLYGMVLDKTEDKEIRDDIKRLVKRIKRKKRVRTQGDDRREKQIHRMQSNLLSKKIKLRTVLEIKPEDQAAFTKQFEKDLMKSIEDILLTEFFENQKPKRPPSNEDS